MISKKIYKLVINVSLSWYRPGKSSVYRHIRMLVTQKAGLRHRKAAGLIEGCEGLSRLLITHTVKQDAVGREDSMTGDALG